MDAGKKSFLWLIAVFVAPILLGTLLFFNLERLGLSKGSVNYGVLVQPATPTVIEDLKQADGQAKPENTITKKWTMLYIASQDCEQACLEKLLLMKRIRLLMNEQMRRVRTLVVSSVDILNKIPKQENPDLVFANVDTKTSIFLKQFPEQDKMPVYLIDPFGNLMMYYPQAEPDAKKMINDLRRLLKYSHLG